MKEALEQLRKKAQDELSAANSRDEILALRTKYLGRKGELTQILRQVKDIPPDEWPAVGQLSNIIKESLSTAIDERLEEIDTAGRDDALSGERIDVTLPGRGIAYGKAHPITTVSREICDIFSVLGFSVVEGPEIEYDYYNFEALNIPKDHPARDMQDTFYVEDDIVLRT
ncbi:MAG: phenylalanine--tRNA ligase subunit alpha, partial [Deltaproteobacteria bacterium]|nr:phenylalanine--tRNA ligase subunit alpha [Deltaproteobacteria bacterium]